MPATTAAERLSWFGSRKVNRLFLSTSEVTFALPCSLRKISRSPSQCPKASRSPTSAGRFPIQRSRGIGVPRDRRATGSACHGAGGRGGSHVGGAPLAAGGGGPPPGPPGGGRGGGVGRGGGA